MDQVVQIGVIGAMQRSHPALTQLWLQWTGIPNLEWAEFSMVRPTEDLNPGTNVMLAPRFHVQETWTEFCNLLSLPEDAPERRRMPIHFPYRNEAHKAFWAAMRRRELEEVDGPVEWWWRLMVMRFKSVHRASQVLIRETIGEEKLLDKGIISFRNPSLKAHGHRANQILDGDYRQPTHVVVSVRVKRDEPHEGLAFSFSEATFRGRFVSKLIDLAVSRT